MTGAAASPRGLLRPQSYEVGGLRLHRSDPDPDVGALVELVWQVSWQLADGEVRTQETLPYPAVHLVVEEGTARVYGVPERRFTRRLAGSGRVLGVRFRPGGFRPLIDGPMSRLRNKVLPAVEVIVSCPPVDALVAAVLEAADDDARAAAAQEWLRPLLQELLSEPDDAVAAAARAVAVIEADPSIVRVEDLAVRLDSSVRSLQRLFSDYVGATPKWVVRRFRMHEAAERAATQVADGPVDWAGIAAELGYYDQPHFIRDFTATVGMSPARYAEQCRQDRAVTS